MKPDFSAFGNNIVIIKGKFTLLEVIDRYNRRERGVLTRWKERQFRHLKNIPLLKLKE